MQISKLFAGKTLFSNRHLKSNLIVLKNVSRAFVVDIDELGVDKILCTFELALRGISLSAVLVYADRTSTQRTPDGRYMVFIKYCVFSEDFKIFQTLAFLCSPSVSVCVHSPGR